MSDDGFEVAAARIVGNQLAVVEQVTGRYTKGPGSAVRGGYRGVVRADGLGRRGRALPGPGWLVLIGTSVVLRAGSGALFGFSVHWAARGLRDFRSVQTLAAGSYDIEVAPHLADRAHSYTIV